ncbi:MAG: hypothetical protein WCY11_04805 [Novosphingobium sp.]
MSFILDKEQVKPGLIIFRRGDVGHDNYYCRVRIQNEDRYKTISLRTADRQAARDRALDEYADIRFRVKHDVPVFNRPFSQVAEEYADAQQRRANAGEVSKARSRNIRSKIDGPLKAYVGSTQIHLVTQERWADYPLWRRENGEGRRKGVISDSTMRQLSSSSLLIYREPRELPLATAVRAVSSFHNRRCGFPRRIVFSPRLMLSPALRRTIGRPAYSSLVMVQARTSNLTQPSLPRSITSAATSLSPIRSALPRLRRS